MIPQQDSQNESTSSLIHSISDELAESRSISTIQSENGLSRLDVAVARVMVKRLVKAGMRKGPSDMLLLPEYMVERWFDEEAKRYLVENLKRKQAGG